MTGTFRLATLIEVTALLMLALCGRASGCSSWRCGRSHRGVAAHETKDIGLFAYGAKLPLGGAAISMSAVQGPDGKVFVAGVRNRPHTLPVPLRPFRASQYFQFGRSLNPPHPHPSVSAERWQHPCPRQGQRYQHRFLAERGDSVGRGVEQHRPRFVQCAVFPRHCRIFGIFGWLLPRRICVRKPRRGY